MSDDFLSIIYQFESDKEIAEELAREEEEITSRQFESDKEIAEELAREEEEIISRQFKDDMREMNLFLGQPIPRKEEIVKRGEKKGEWVGGTFTYTYKHSPNIHIDYNPRKN